MPQVSLKSFIVVELTNYDIKYLLQSQCDIFLPATVVAVM